MPIIAASSPSAPAPPTPSPAADSPMPIPTSTLSPATTARPPRQATPCGKWPAAGSNGRLRARPSLTMATVICCTCRARLVCCTRSSTPPRVRAWCPTYWHARGVEPAMPTTASIICAASMRRFHRSLLPVQAPFCVHLSGCGTVAIWPGLTGIGRHPTHLAFWR
jgi:hypothetical protein